MECDTQVAITALIMEKNRSNKNVTKNVVMTVFSKGTPVVVFKHTFAVSLRIDINLI